MIGPHTERPAAPLEPGTPVRVCARPSLGHCRTPAYLRGKAGTIIDVAGRYKDPERLAYHKPGLPTLMLYRVRFAQKELWPDYPGAAIDGLEADVYEHWLELAQPDHTERGP